MFLADQWQDYEVLDCGGGEKPERWGDVYLRRPDPQAIWPARDPSLWRKAQAHHHRSEKGGGSWEFFTKLPDRWVMNYKTCVFTSARTGFKHTGLFPEQATNWDWMTGLVSDRVKQGERGARAQSVRLHRRRDDSLRGGGAAGLPLRRGQGYGAVGAGKPRVQRPAGGSRALDHRRRAQVRAARGAPRPLLRLGFLMDPPSYGRGPSGEVWKLENELYGLAKACSEALSMIPLFFLINGYTTGFQASVLGNMIDMTVKSPASAASSPRTRSACP